MLTPGEPRRARRFLLAVLGALLLVILVLGAAAPRIVADQRAGQIIGWLLPPMRGRATVGGADWSWSAVWHLVRGQPAEFALRDVRVIDPEGSLVLSVGQARGRIQLLREPWRVVLLQPRLSAVRWRLAPLAGTPDLGFLAAFQPARATGGSGPPSDGPWLRAQGVRLDDLDATLEFPGWGLSLRGVHAGGDLALSDEAQRNGRGAPVSFALRDADAVKGGELRLGVGPGALTLPLSRARVDQLVTVREASGVSRGTLHLKASNLLVGQSVLSTEGDFQSVLGKGSGDGAAAIDLTVSVSRPADALTTFFGSQLPEALRLTDQEGATLALSLHGPLADPIMDVTARGLAASYHGAAVRDIDLDGTADPGAGQYQVRHLTLASSAGGRLDAEGAVDPQQLTARLQFQSLRWPSLPDAPPVVAALVGGVLDGRAAVSVDRPRQRVTIGALALDWIRPPGGGGPRIIRLRGSGTTRAPSDRTPVWRLREVRLAAGVLEIPTITVPVAGGWLQGQGRVRLFDGAGAGSSLAQGPSVDLGLVVSHVSLQGALGEGFVTGKVSLRARVRGTFDRLAIRIALPAGQRVSVLGQPYRLPRRMHLRFDQRRLIVPALRFASGDGVKPGQRWLEIQGTAALDGELELAVGLAGFPFGGLPALAEASLPFSGRLTGNLQVQGPSGGHLISGQLQIREALFQGRPIGGGRLLIQPRPGGAIAAVGSVIEGVTVDGVLEPDGRGLRGQAALTLDHVRLDPFLPELPGDLSAAGIVSGVLQVRLNQGQPSVDARLTQLRLSVTVPFLAPAPARARTRTPGARTIVLDAQGDVRLSVRRGDLRLFPARFVGPAGSLEIAARRQGGVAEGQVKGRLDLGGLAPFALRWLDHLEGTIDLDLSAGMGTGGGRPGISGSVVVVAPLVANLPGVPFPVGVSRGRLELDGASARVADLAIQVGASTFTAVGRIDSGGPGEPTLAFDINGVLPASLIQALAPPDARLTVAGGGARVSARIDGLLSRPRWRASLTPQDLTLASVALGPHPLRLSGGEISIEPPTVGVRAVEVQVGSVVRATIAAAALGRGHWSGWAPPRLYGLQLPITGTISGLVMPQGTIDDASFAVTLTGDPAQRLRLAGVVDLRAVHVRTGGPQQPAAGAAAPPLLAGVDLDLHVRSSPGAITVEVRHAPDVHVGVDLQLRGAASRPLMTGRIRPAGAYSHVSLFLYRLFHR